MLVSRMPIARKLSLQALSCEIQHEGLNSSLVSARLYLKMSEKKKWYQETYCLLTAALWVFCIPGVSNCRTHLKRTASADPCKASFCGQLWGFLHRRETNSSHCPTLHKVPPLTFVSHLQWFYLLYFSWRIWLLNTRSSGSSTCSGITAQNFSSPSDWAYG